MDDLLAARSQMAMSLAFHIVFAAIGIAMPLFSARVVGFFPYDVAPDGRFLLAAVEDAGAAANESPVTVELNWQSLLKK